MRYFRVEEDYLSGVIQHMEVESDGESVGDPYSVSDTTKDITLGFTVFEEDDMGIALNTEFYPVKTDTRAFTDNKAEVLAQIQADYPPEEWQNHRW